MALNTIVSTGTVGSVQLTPEGDKVVLNIVQHRSWTNKDGEVQHNRAVIRGTYTFKSPEEAAELVFEKNSRVGFKGVITGDFGANGSTNGPHVVETDKGFVCAYEADLSYLSIIGPKAKNQMDYDDVTEVIVWGFVGRDPTLRYTKGDTPQAVCSTSIAFNYIKYVDALDEDGNKKDKKEKKTYTVWWNIVLFGPSAETAADPNRGWRKGKGLIVQGTLLADQTYGGPNIWERQDGSKAANNELNVASWTFAPSKKEAGPDYEKLASSQSSAADDDIPF
jgi:single-stranded DNA-binding protein